MQALWEMHALSLAASQLDKPLVQAARSVWWAVTLQYFFVVHLHTTTLFSSLRTLQARRETAAHSLCKTSLAHLGRDEYAGLTQRVWLICGRICCFSLYIDVLISTIGRGNFSRWDPGLSRNNKEHQYQRILPMS